MFWLGMLVTKSLEQKELLAVHNITQLKIISVLDREEPLSAKEITSKLKLKYKRIYKELQKLVDSGIILKDKHKLYSVNSEYGELLIDYGMKIKGLKIPPNTVIFIKKFDELKETVEYLKKLMKRDAEE